jgi:hypothetical protein
MRIAKVNTASMSAREHGHFTDTRHFSDCYRFHTNQTRKPTHATNSNGSPIRISGPNITEDISVCHRVGVGHGFFIGYHRPPIWGPMHRSWQRHAIRGKSTHIP